MALRKILKVTTSKGFTLVEILIVVGLIALVSAIAIPSLNFVLKTSPETFARQVSELLKEARDRALLNNSIVRFRADLDKQQYWLEEAPSSILLPSLAEQEKKAEEKKSDKEKEEKAKEENSDGFRQLKEITKDKKDIPRGLKLVELVSPRAKKPITEGDAYIYFFPHGTADNSVLHIEDEDGGKESILVQPVTGLTAFRPGFLTSEDVQ